MTSDDRSRWSGSARHRRRQQQDRRRAGLRGRHGARVTRAVLASSRTCVGADAAVDGLAPLVAKSLPRRGCRSGRAVPLVEHVSACLANADLPIEAKRLAGRDRAHGLGQRRARRQRHLCAAACWARRGPRRGRRVRRRHQLRGPAARTAARRGSRRSAGSRAIGAVATSCGRKRCGGRRAPRTAAATRRSCARRCPRHFGLPSMQALIEALHLGDIPRIAARADSGALRRRRART